MTENFRKALEAAATAGWNACRKSIYAVCEDVQERAVAPAAGSMARTEAEKSHEKGFFAGERSAAKSIARGFNSMEAQDDNYFRDAIATVNPAKSEAGSMLQRAAAALIAAGTAGFTCTYEAAAQAVVDVVATTEGWVDINSLTPDQKIELGESLCRDAANQDRAS